MCCMSKLVHDYRCCSFDASINDAWVELIYSSPVEGPIFEQKKKSMSGELSKRIRFVVERKTMVVMKCVKFLLRSICNRPCL